MNEDCIAHTPIRVNLSLSSNSRLFLIFIYDLNKLQSKQEFYKYLNKSNAAKSSQTLKKRADLDLLDDGNEELIEDNKHKANDMRMYRLKTKSKINRSVTQVARNKDLIS